MKKVSSNSQPVDIVITWVDGNDPKWIEEKERFIVNKESNIDYERWSKSDIRFRDWGTLKYIFRGIEKYCKWANKIYFVTWGHIPGWLNTKNPRLVIVNHKDFIPKEYLPTYNSNAIELNMHRIKGLSENFVYFNDDTFVIKKTKKEDFFRNNLPTHSAMLNVVMPDEIMHPEYYNTVIINKYFNKNDVLKKNFTKWFNIKYFPQIARTMLLMPWPKFTRLYETHLPLPLQKSTFEELWNLEPQVIEKTCNSHFREKDNISIWLMSDWYRLKGEFVPRRPNLGRHYSSNRMSKILSIIRKKKMKIICVDDFGGDTYEEFLHNKKILQAELEMNLPDKSEFEK